jgi:HPt (histidine-containing phosphotransfer) domain-containing protein
MTADANDRLAEQLRELRREYLADSEQRIQELRGLLGRITASDLRALPELRQAFHRLAGSGGSYGFPAVSARSREGEQLARRLEGTGAAVAPADLKSLDACVEAVAEAFADARKAVKGESARAP